MSDEKDAQIIYFIIEQQVSHNRNHISQVTKVVSEDATHWQLAQDVYFSG